MEETLQNHAQRHSCNIRLNKGSGFEEKSNVLLKNEIDPNQLSMLRTMPRCCPYLPGPCPTSPKGEKPSGPSRENRACKVCEPQTSGTSSNWRSWNMCGRGKEWRQGRQRRPHWAPNPSLSTQAVFWKRWEATGVFKQKWLGQLCNENSTLVVLVAMTLRSSTNLYLCFTIQ